MTHDTRHDTRHIRVSSNLELRKVLQSLEIGADILVLSAKKQWVKVTRNSEGIDIRHINGHSASFIEATELSGYDAWGIINVIHRITAQRLTLDKKQNSRLDKIRTNRLD